MANITVSDYVTTVCREYRNNKTTTMEYLLSKCGTYSTTLFHVGMATHKISKNAENRSFDIVPHFMCERLLDEDGLKELNGSMKIFNEFIDKLLTHMQITDDIVIFNDPTVIEDYSSVVNELKILESTVTGLETYEYGDLGTTIEQLLQNIFGTKNEICGLMQHIYISKELSKLNEFIKSSSKNTKITAVGTI